MKNAKIQAIAAGVLALLVSAVFLTGCDNANAQGGPVAGSGDGKSSFATDPALLGIWDVDRNKSKVGISLTAMVLLSDGTGILYGTGCGLGMTWKTESGRLYMLNPTQSFSGDYKVSGATLALACDNGDVLECAKRETGKGKREK